MGDSMGRFRKQTPGEGKRVISAWSAIKLDAGEGMNLFKIGPTLWFWCHNVNGLTKPCLHEFTGGEVRCTRCGTRDYWQGYTPCYDETGARLLALPKESNRAVDDKIRPGQCVYVSRKRGKQQPMTIAPRPWGKDWILTDRDHAALGDLEERLVMIWKDQSIAEWFARQGGERVTLREVIEKATESRDTADADAKFLRDHVARSIHVRPADPASDGPVSLADSLPGVNGKHKRK